MYFGTYTFVIREAFPTIDVNPCPTASVKKLNKIIPESRYTGKLLIPERNMVENTIY